MEARRESRTGTVVAGINPVLRQIHDQLGENPKEWLAKLQEDPGAFADVEKEIHRVFAQMADQIVAGLLAEATADPGVAQAAQKK